MASTSKTRAIKARERRSTISTVLKRIGGWVTEMELQRYAEGPIRPIREDLKALGKAGDLEVIEAKHWDELEGPRRILIARVPQA